jgi:hypothetical protein
MFRAASETTIIARWYHAQHRYSAIQGHFKRLFGRTHPAMVSSCETRIFLEAKLVPADRSRPRLNVRPGSRDPLSGCARDVDRRVDFNTSLRFPSASAPLPQHQIRLISSSFAAPARWWHASTRKHTKHTKYTKHTKHRKDRLPPYSLRPFNGLQRANPSITKRFKVVCDDDRRQEPLTFATFARQSVTTPTMRPPTGTHNRSLIFTILSFSQFFALIVSAIPISDSGIEKRHWRCTTVYANGASTPCTLSGSQSLAWDAAHRLADVHRLDVEIESPGSTTGVFEFESATAPMDRPFPTPTECVQSHSPGTKFLCTAFSTTADDACRAACTRMLEARALAQEERVSGVVMVVVLGVLLWGIVECLWEQCFGKEGGVKLDGDERRLSADADREELSGGEEERRMAEGDRCVEEKDPGTKEEDPRECTWKEFLRTDAEVKEIVWGP